MNRLLAATLCAVYYHGVLVAMVAAVIFNVIFIMPAKAQLKPAPENWDEIFSQDDGNFQVVCYKKGNEFKYCGTRTYFTNLYGANKLLSWTWGYDGDKRMMFKVCHPSWYGKGVTGEWKEFLVAFENGDFHTFELMYWDNLEVDNTFACFEGWGPLHEGFVKSYVLGQGKKMIIKIGKHIVPNPLTMEKVEDNVRLAIEKAVEFRRK